MEFFFEIGIVNKWLMLAIPVLSSCVAEAQQDPLDDYIEHDTKTILNSPSVDPADVAPKNREYVDRGEYLVELLGCGSCHTNGALIGMPESASALSGSDVGIAYTTPLQNEHPGVVYPPNITPDLETGIGGWTERQIVDAFRRGEERHGGNLAPVMPWPGYNILSDRDAYSIASYLQHIDPISHRVPENVPRGTRARGRYVYFGVYEKE